jgi:hypothetical protein
MTMATHDQSFFCIYCGMIACYGLGADSTSIGGLTSRRSAWSRCPYWLKVEACRLLPGVVLS